MKFNKTLKSLALPEWLIYFIKYKAMKGLLRDIRAGRRPPECFWECLADELNKVFLFYASKEKWAEAQLGKLSAALSAIEDHAPFTPRKPRGSLAASPTAAFAAATTPLPLTPRAISPADSPFISSNAAALAHTRTLAPSPLVGTVQQQQAAAASAVAVPPRASGGAAAAPFEPVSPSESSALTYATTVSEPISNVLLFPALDAALFSSSEQRDGHPPTVAAELSRCIGVPSTHHLHALLSSFLALRPCGVYHDLLSQLSAVAATVSQTEAAAAGVIAPLAETTAASSSTPSTSSSVAGIQGSATTALPSAADEKAAANHLGFQGSASASVPSVFIVENDVEEAEYVCGALGVAPSSTRAPAGTAQVTASAAAVSARSSLRIGCVSTRAAEALHTLVPLETLAPVLPAELQRSNCAMTKSPVASGAGDSSAISRAVDLLAAPTVGGSEAGDEGSGTGCCCLPRCDGRVSSANTSSDATPSKWVGNGAVVRCSTAGETQPNSVPARPTTPPLQIKQRQQQQQFPQTQHQHAQPDSLQRLPSAHNVNDIKPVESDLPTSEVEVAMRPPHGPEGEVGPPRGLGAVFDSGGSHRCYASTATSASASPHSTPDHRPLQLATRLVRSGHPQLQLASGGHLSPRKGVLLLLRRMRRRTPLPISIIHGHRRS